MLTLTKKAEVTGCNVDGVVVAFKNTGTGVSLGLHEVLERLALPKCFYRLLVRIIGCLPLILKGLDFIKELLVGSV